MANWKKFEAKAKVGEWTDDAGRKRGRYVQCGVVFENDNGELSLKLDSVPVSPDWHGWINLFPPRERSDNDGYAG